MPWIQAHYRGGGPSRQVRESEEMVPNQPPPASAQPPQPAGPEGMGQTLSSRPGGIPMWVWLIGGVLLVYLYMRYRSSHQSTTTTGTSTQGVAQQPVDTSPLASNLVGVQEQTPGLAGSYQVTVTPDQNTQQAPVSSTPLNLTQNPASDTMTPVTTGSQPGSNVSVPQTSSPQQGATPSGAPTG